MSNQGYGQYGSADHLRRFQGVMLVAIAGLGTLAAGCAHHKNAETQPAPVGPYSGVANNVNVTMSANSVAAPEIIGSGWTNFVVTNADTVAHSFGIEGNGINRILSGSIAPGQTQQLRVQLRPGTYRIYCPMCGADMTGMSRQLIVAQW